MIPKLQNFYYCTNKVEIINLTGRLLRKARNDLQL